MSKILMSDELIARLQNTYESPTVNIGTLKGNLDSILLSEALKRVEFSTTNTKGSMELLQRKFPIQVIIKYDQASLDFDFQSPKISVEFVNSRAKVILEETDE